MTMRQTAIILSFLLFPVSFCMAQGWPSPYEGVMLQAFSWDSFNETKWTVLEQQANELGNTFDLVWIPQSGNCNGQSMGYDDVYWFTNYNSSFGNEAELRSLIQSFKSNGITTIADVVINHRRSTNGWFGFPSETYKGVAYSMGPSDVCSDDDNGKAATEAKRIGVTLGNKDTGEGWDGMRDLDHKSTNVQNTVKAYLNFLLNDLGYGGFRYDMVKGFSPSFTAAYNKSANPGFSVGECWDGSSVIRNWIDGTKADGVIQSAAFDFQFKYVMRNAVDKKDWTWLGKVNDNVSTNWPLISNNFEQGSYRRYAVTFVENHDTQVRQDGSSGGPLKKDTLAANAYMLAMPGTPCVFQPHWLAYPTEIKAMVGARKFAGINNESSYDVLASAKQYYACTVKTADENRLLVVVGDVAAAESSASLSPLITPTSPQWVKVLSGYHYAYYFPASIETAYAELPSGYYTGKQKVMLTAVTSSEGAQIVYTTNDTEPTPASTAVASGTQITIPAGTTTLKAGMLIGGQVIGVVTRHYVVTPSDTDDVVIPSFCTYAENEVCAFFEAPATWTQTIMCWAWDTQNYTGGNWPGEACTKLGTAPNGNSVWKWTYTGTLTTQPEKIIFSNNGSPQTADLVFKNRGYYVKSGLFDIVSSGLHDVTADSPTPPSYYTLDGRRLQDMPHSPGIYIVNKKKVIIR